MAVIGETKIFPRLTIEPARLRDLIRLVWQASTVAWIGWRRAPGRRSLDGIRPGAALDRRHHGLRVLH